MVIDMARKCQFLKLVLTGNITDRPASFQPFARKEQFSLQQLLQLLQAVRDDPKTQAVLVVVKNLSIGWAQIEEIHRTLKRFRDREKQVVALLEQATNKTYYLATAADRIYLPPSATLELVGLRSETLYFKNLLSYLGVEPELFSLGAYKSAAEIFQREKMSEAAREMTDTILADLQGRLVEEVAENRGVATKLVENWIDNGPYTARRSLSAGMVDGVVYEDEMNQILESSFPGIRETHSLRRRLREGFFKRLITFYRPQIAVMVAEGVISLGESRRTRGRWPILGAETLISFLRDARRRRRVRAVVLRINSPGGSTIASDLIWREIRLTDQSKPVIATFGDVAASGGYYLATAAREVFANPSTLTGSIGVIGGKFNIEHLLSKIGITTDSVEKGSHSGYASATRPFSLTEAKSIQGQMSEFYEDLFLPKVAASRGRSIGEIRSLAEGRVWTGAQALIHGLVDTKGGLEEALETTKALTGLEEKRSRLLTYVQRRSILDLLPLQLGQSLPEDRVLALMPEDIVIE
jgi:protease-4